MTTEIASGVVVSGREIGTVSAGQSVLVDAGGTAVSITFDAGTEQVLGVDSGASLMGHGFQAISAGGSAIGATVTDGAMQTVYSDGETVSTTLRAGGMEIVSGDAIVSRTTVSSGGSFLLSSGTAVSTTVDAGGYASIEATASGVTIGSGGFVTVSAGGDIVGGSLGSGGLAIVQIGGTATGIDIQSGGFLIAEPGAIVSASGAGTVISSGIAVVQSATKVTAYASSGVNLSLGSGEQALVLSGGIAIGGALGSGAALMVYSGGATSDAALNGGYEVVSAGGIAVGTIVDNASVEYIFSGASASATTVDSGFAIVEAGGSASDVTVNSDGNLTVDGYYSSGSKAVTSEAGLVTTATVADGGTLYVTFEGSAISATVEAGGAAYIFGALASGILESGSYAIVESAVSKVEAAGSGGALLATTLAGGTAIVESDGLLSGDTIAGGGVALVHGGGTSLDTTVSSGGTLILLQGASSSDTTSSGAATIISAGAVVIEQPLSVTVSAGSAADSVLGSGSSAFVLSGAVANDITIQNYAGLDVGSGGTATNTVIAAGGMLTVDAGGVLSGVVTFSGIQGSIAFESLSAGDATISGFTSGDALYFDAISGGSAELAVVSGHELEITGTLVGGTSSVSATVDLDPSSSYTAGDFQVTTTKTGGAEITAASAAADVTSSGLSSAVEPVNIPLYVLSEGGDQYKIGIEISLDGGATYRMYEFDTGGTGLYAAYGPSWWSPYTVVDSSPTIFAYTSGNTYTAQVVATTVTFQTSASGTVSTDSDIGLISTAESPDKFTAQEWNADITDTPSTPPLQTYFYGDFGAGLSSNENGVDNLLSQLGAGLSDGFIVSVGTYPGDNSGEVGNLQVGITPEDLAEYTTISLMQGANFLDTFANTGETSYQELLAEGMAVVSAYDSGTLNVASGTTEYVFDTGAPTTEIHPGTTFQLSGTVSGGVLSAGPASSTDSGWTLDITSGGASISSDNAIGNTTGYVNTGLDAFWGVSVMFDLADGIIGFMVTCFAEGTAITTPGGAAIIENLRIGDLVQTISGEARPIAWIGYRGVDCTHHPRPETVLPVRILAHAFGQGLPRRDLYLSPDHALYADGVLIPVKYLIDGDAVAQVDRPRLTYYHIELASHDVILAEGLPAETYLETGQRSAFANGGSVVQAHPDFAPALADAQMRWAAEGYAPLVVTGPAVDRLRRRLVRSRPAVSLSASPARARHGSGSPR